MFKNISNVINQTLGIENQEGKCSNSLYKLKNQVTSAVKTEFLFRYTQWASGKTLLVFDFESNQNPNFY